MAGWSLPRPFADRFPEEGSHLARYAQRLTAVEINSSFHRPHRRTTYERWAATVPADFRFAVKLPKTITHERRLLGVEDLLDRFLEEALGLGDKLGPLLVQLPPSFAFDRAVAGGFFDLLRSRWSGQVACEPRHPSWFDADAEALLAVHEVARVAADPAPDPRGATPGGWPGLAYHRLHGSPRVYYSDYPEAALEALAPTLVASAATRETWCVFDNTTLGHAVGNALTLAEICEGAAAEPPPSAPPTPPPLRRGGE